MLWWILSGLVTLLVVGYVAHKFPSMFGKAVDSGAAVVNKIDNSVKATVSKSSNTA